MAIGGYSIKWLLVIILLMAIVVILLMAIGDYSINAY
jgi:hypothetical protein